MSVDLREDRDGAGEFPGNRRAPESLELDSPEHDARGIGRCGHARGVASGPFGRIELSLVVEPAGIGERVSGMKGHRRKPQPHREAQRTHARIVTHAAAAAN